MRGANEASEGMAAAAVGLPHRKIEPLLGVKQRLQAMAGAGNRKQVAGSRE